MDSTKLVVMLARSNNWIASSASASTLNRYSERSVCTTLPSAPMSVSSTSIQAPVDHCRAVHPTRHRLTMAVPLANPLADDAAHGRQTGVGLLPLDRPTVIRHGAIMP